VHLNQYLDERSRGWCMYIRKLLLAFCFLAATSVTSAADFYFSDEASTLGQVCTSKDNPCGLINDGSSGLSTSFAYLVDGANADDASPTDTIHLCCGSDCDNSGFGTDATCTYPIVASTTCDGKAVWLAPKVDDITVQTFCTPDRTDGDNCASVEITGDINDDCIWQTNEVHHFIDLEDAGAGCAGSKDADDWTIQGAPDDLLIFEDVGNHMFNLDANQDCATCGFGGWVFDYIDASHTTGSKMTGLPGYGCPDESFGAFTRLSCAGNARGHIFKIGKLVGPLTVRRSYLHDSCGKAHRELRSFAHADADALYENNIYEDIGIANPHGPHTSDGVMLGSWTFQNNTTIDATSLIFQEGSIDNILIQDNIFKCLGVENADFNFGDWVCYSAIKVVNGDSNSTANWACDAPLCDWGSVIIRRNLIYGTNVSGGSNAEGSAAFDQGIYVTPRTDSGGETSCLVENNIIYNTRARGGFDPRNVAIGFKSLDGSACTIQNNTIYNAHKTGIWIEGGDLATFRNNIVITDRSGAFALNVASGAPTIQNNNFLSTAETEVIVGASGTFTCPTVTTLGTGNICEVSTFINTSDADVANWNLHLPVLDQINRDRGNATSASDDFDEDTRPDAQDGISDIGADEITSIHLRNFYLLNGSSDLVGPGSPEYNLNVGTSAIDNEEFTVDVDFDTAEQGYFFTTAAFPDWKNWWKGTWTVTLDITKAADNITITDLNIQRIEADGTFVSAYGTLPSGLPKDLSTTGLKSIAGTITAPKTGATTDRLRFGIMFTRDTDIGGNSTVKFKAGTSFITLPIDESAGTMSTSSGSTSSGSTRN